MNALPVWWAPSLALTSVPGAASLGRMTRSCALIALVTVALLLPGCGFKRRHECKATISHAGKTVTGRGTDFNDPARATEHAKKNICETYCYEQDPAVDAALKSQPTPPTSLAERYMTAHQPAVEPVFKTCVSTCTAATASATPLVTCGTTGFLLAALAGADAAVAELGHPGG